MPLVLALAAPENPLFIMREKEGLVDPNAQITEAIGSGPFIFVKEEWAPGNKVVYRKNPAYVPRAEKPKSIMRRTAIGTTSVVVAATTSAMKAPSARQR